MRKPSFTVVTIVVVVLATLGVATKELQPFMPPPPANKLADSPQAFLSQAGHQAVQWQPYGPAAFSEARHEGRPILFLVGGPWSTTARKLDDRVFTDDDVVQYLSTNFVCVRVDASADRRWLSALLPYSRMPLMLLPGFQAFILDSEGRMVGVIGKTGAEVEYSADAFLSELIGAIQMIDRIDTEGQPPVEPGQLQAADLAFLEDSPRGKPLPFELYAQNLASYRNTPTGGFPEHRLQPMLPDAFRYLLLVGRTTDAAQTLDPFVFSPAYDFVDGGFFRLLLNDGSRTVEFDKLATANASMAWTLALAHRATKNSAYRLLARSTVDWLLGTMTANGLVATCTIGIAQRNGRSRRHSFSLPSLRKVLTEWNVKWLRRNLNLEPSQNPQMVPYYTDSKGLMQAWARASLVRSRLTKLLRQDPIATVDSAEAHCYTVARLLQVIRLWRDPNLDLRVSELAASSDRFWQHGSVKANTGDDVASDYLGDWIAYADVCLERFISFGDPETLERGASALRKAIGLFAGTAPGEFLSGIPIIDALAPQNANAPEVADSVQESCTARMIRLCWAYGQLLGDVTLERRAQATVELYSTALAEAGPLVAGYYCSAYEVEKRRTVFVVGRDATSKVRDLFRTAPTDLVAPAIGPVGKELQKRSPGVYLSTPSGPKGPLDMEAAAQALAPRASQLPDAP